MPAKKKENNVVKREHYEKRKVMGPMVLLQDIVIPKGTVFHASPEKTERIGDGHFSATIGLSRDTSGEVDYYLDPDDAFIENWFTELKGL